MSRIGEFCKRKNIVFSAKRYGIDALGAMAQGLFCSLLIGTIIKTLGAQLNIPFLTDIGSYAMAVSGPAMAVAIGYALQAPPMVLFSLAAVGWAANAEGGAGGPLAVLIIAIVAAECGKAVSKETKIDILVTPAVTILIGVALAKWIAPPIGTAASAFGIVIDQATKLQPFWMGIAVSVLVGVALTLPISSAAICSVLGLTGLAGGAAVAGCCAQMVGFAVMSFKENRWGGLVSQGLGTSMLQMPNIVRNPRIWIAPTLCSAITGPIATCVFAGDERRADQLRHGHLRPLRADWRVDGLAGPDRGSHRQGRAGHLPHRIRLDRARAHRHRAPRGHHAAAEHDLPETRLGQGRGSETVLILRAGQKFCPALVFLRSSPYNETI